MRGNRAPPSSIRLARAPFLPTIGRDAQADGVTRADDGNRGGPGQPGDLLLQGVSATHVRWRGCGLRGKEIERHRCRINRDHATCKEAEVADGLRRDESVGDARHDAAGSFNRANWRRKRRADLGHARGDDCIFGRHRDAQARRGVVTDLVLRIPVASITEQPFRFRGNRLRVVGLRAALVRC
mgnify:CR=1 FL=1